jgi:hypothetical protein
MPGYPKDDAITEPLPFQQEPGDIDTAVVDIVHQTEIGQAVTQHRIDAGPQRHLVHRFQLSNTTAEAIQALRAFADFSQNEIEELGWTIAKGTFQGGRRVDTRLVWDCFLRIENIGDLPIVNDWIRHYIQREKVAAEYIPVFAAAGTKLRNRKVHQESLFSTALTKATNVEYAIAGALLKAGVNPDEPSEYVESLDDYLTPLQKYVVFDSDSDNGWSVTHDFFVQIGPNADPTSANGCCTKQIIHQLGEAKSPGYGVNDADSLLNDLVFFGMPLPVNILAAEYLSDMQDEDRRATILAALTKYLASKPVLLDRVDDTVSDYITAYGAIHPDIEHLVLTEFPELAAAQERQATLASCTRFLHQFHPPTSREMDFLGRHHATTNECCQFLRTALHPSLKDPILLKVRARLAQATHYALIHPGPSPIADQSSHRSIPSRNENSRSANGSPAIQK